MYMFIFLLFYLFIYFVDGGSIWPRFVSKEAKASRGKCHRQSLVAQTVINECQRIAVGVDIITELDEEKQICVDLAHKGNKSLIYMNSNAKNHNDQKHGMPYSI